MTSFHPEVLDVGGARLAHPEPIQAKENCEGRVHPVDALGGEEKG
jgi:hypothetical protein